MHPDNAHPQERTDSPNRRRVTGPHAGYDRRGRIDHLYWRCERCGLESTDAALREDCFRCGASGVRGSETPASRPGRGSGAGDGDAGDTGADRESNARARSEEDRSRPVVGADAE